MDQELEELKRQIDDLTRLMRDLSGTVASLDDTILAKFGISIKKNTQALDDNTQAVKQSNKLVDQFGRELKSTTKATEKSTEATEDETRARLRSTYAVREQIRLAATQNSTVKNMIDEYGHVTSASAVMRDRFEKLGPAAGIVVEGLKGLGNATLQMASSLYKGERGALVVARSMTELTKPLQEFALSISAALVAISLIPGVKLGKVIMGLGTAIAAAAAALGVVNKFNEAAAEQNDKLFKTFNDLSRSGAAAATGMEGVFQDLQTLGMSVSEIEKFGEIVKSNSKTLALFGATAADGTREFSKIAGSLYKSRLGEQLELIGITANDQREATLSYMSILARTGQLQGRSTDQLVKGSAAYAKELDLLARLTGTSREEAAKQMEANLADAKFRAALTEAQARGDQAEIDRLMMAGKLATFFESQGLTELAVGTRALAAGGGAVTGPQAVQALNVGVREALATGDFGQAVKSLSRTLPQFNQNMAGVVRFSGNLEGYAPDFAKTQDAAEKLALINQKFGGDIDAFLKSELERGKTADKSTVANVQAARTQQAAALMMDTAVATFNDSARINKSASEAFRDAVNVFNRTVGVKPVPGGVPMTGATPGAGAAAAPGTAPGGSRLGAAAARKRGGAGTAQPGVQGLRLKSSEAVSGGEADPRLIGLAHQIQNQLGGDLLYFSALNDTYERGGNSKHSSGLALDFTLRNPKYSAGSADLVRSILAQSGLQGRVIDEYLNPSKSATGGHIHVELEPMAKGGVLSGPRSGYAALLHGTEAVVPLPDGRNIPVKLDNRETNESLNRQLTTLQMQLGKMDEMIGVMRENNSISSKILQVSRN